MIEYIPEVIDTAFLYFHTRCSSGSEIAPFVKEIRTTLPEGAGAPDAHMFSEAVHQIRLALR
jgi:hypothetical protein